jgi:hypothetical protein
MSALSADEGWLRCSLSVLEGGGADSSAVSLALRLVYGALGGALLYLRSLDGSVRGWMIPLGDAACRAEIGDLVSFG